ncbi:MAG: hypothetical protein RJA57_361 [Bacteroidota bacterium]|jgi:hypothetical protein
MKRIWTWGLPLVAVSFLLLYGCSKDDRSGTHTLRVRLTDNPVNAEAVLVDIQQVRVNYRADSSGWVDLATQTGIYDLLGLQNGVDTLLAQGSVPGNSVKEIRFVLGPNNSIRVSGITYPLTIPSGAESGLKLKIDKQLTAPLDSLIIDFDAALSVHQAGPSNYQLRPVLRIK